MFEMDGFIVMWLICVLFGLESLFIIVMMVGVMECDV